MEYTYKEMQETVGLYKSFKQYCEDKNAYYALSCLQEMDNKIHDYLYKIGFITDKDKELDIDKVLEKFNK